MPPRWQARRPTQAVLARLRDELAQTPLSYRRDELPSFVYQRDEQVIGRPEHFAKASQRLYTMNHLRVDGIEVLDEPAVVGNTVSFSMRVGPLWALCACRILEVQREAERGVVTYGTLPIHGVVGQESFALRVVDGQLLFAIEKRFAARGLVSWAPPVVSRLQRRFVEQLVQGMRNVCR